VRVTGHTCTSPSREWL